MNENKVEQLEEQLEELKNEIGPSTLLKKYGTVHYTLTKPFQFCGKTYETLEMNFEGLTGKDMEAIDSELSAMRITVTSPVNSHVYQKMLAAKAAGVPSDMLENLPLADYNKITTMAMSFLAITG